MSKKEDFKNFAKLHPNLGIYLKNHSDMSWQKFYELYDIYGEDETAWQKFLEDNNPRSQSPIDTFKDLMKNIDTKTLQDQISSAQKALGFIEELTTKGAKNVNEMPKGPKSPRPLNKFFGD